MQYSTKLLVEDMTSMPENETYNRILDVAAELFSARGYEGVTLRDIGNAVNIKHASLYYYAPQGKTQLYMAVMERNFERHRDGITDAIATAETEVRAQLRAVGRWLISQPPMNMTRVIHTESAAIGKEQATRLAQLAYEALRQPLVRALRAARERGEITQRNLDMAALSFVTLIEVVHGVPTGMNQAQMEAYIDEVIEMLMMGWVARS
jgi:AcrR family transcriptional regulator